MAYRVKIADSAVADAERAYLWMKGEYGDEVATAWFNELVDAVQSLEEMPLRFPRAREAEDLGIDLRQETHVPGSAAHRILFAVQHDPAHNADVVKVYRIWHAARQDVRRDDLAPT